MKQKIATGLINKLKSDFKDLERKALDSISEVEEKYKIEKDGMMKEINRIREESSIHKVHLDKLSLENRDEREKMQHLEKELPKDKKCIAKDEMGTDKINQESSVAIYEELT